ncbi:MAG: phosphoribosylformylglycinamidine cyclo-ligase [Candidatus Omnitrophica bacterium]|nr:phosphoribosylformylglycinamidine cyclo-ligase [Candidatus Omnitrophota bacterium]
MKDRQTHEIRNPKSEIRNHITYREAGVDIETADAWLSRMRPLIRSTHRSGALPDRGQFAGLFRLAATRLRDPILVASTDGVGTKLKVAQLLDKHEAIGVDAVAMNANDVLVYGAKPIFFLDYIAVGALQDSLLSSLLRGVVRGCRESGCVLLGGETAEMPGVYRRGAYDIAGFCVGVVERARLIDGSTVRPGDAIIGLASSGIHANGFSLVRRVLTRAQLTRLGLRLLVPTRIYVKPVLAALRRISIHAMAHVTGGGLARRIPSLAAGRPVLRARLVPGSWRVPAVFHKIQEAGHLSTDEMMATFNMGIGMALVCASRDADRLIRIMGAAGIAAWPIGRIEHQ